jgi:hypothetical protein
MAKATELLRELEPERAGELTETLDTVLDVLIERMGAARADINDVEGRRRYARLRLGVAFLLGLRDRVSAL